MEIVNEEIEKYIEQHTSPESDLLSRVNRETHLYELMPRMLSGHVQGRFLAMMSKMIRPQYILEIGTYTGYSAICLAEGLQPEGELHTIDVNAELLEKNKAYFAEAGMGEKIIPHIGNALEIIPALSAIDFDLVFIDADKANYGHYFDLVIDKLKPGSFILADNVLWSGKVLGRGPKKIDKDTQALIDFNQKVQNDSRVENVIVPMRDGISVMRKR